MTMATNGSGSSWQNGFIESFNGRFMVEFLIIEMFTIASESPILVALWRW